jgi:hypothetical protein
MKSQPFLTFVFRCTKRYKPIKRALSSLRKQTDRDYQILCLADEKGRGIGWANHNLPKQKQYVRGKYVYLYEDDDEFIYNGFVKKLKRIVKKNNNPDVIFVKAFIGAGADKTNKDISLYPLKKYWGKKPGLAKIGTPCFIVSNEIYQEYIQYFAKNRSADYNFISHVWEKKDLKVFWWDKIVNKSFRMNNKVEEKDFNMGKVFKGFKIPKQDRIYCNDNT